MAGAIDLQVKAIASPFPKISLPGPAYLGPHQIGMIVVTCLLLALFAFFRFTPLGLAMRAAAQNPSSARLAGVRVDWMLALGWGLAAAIGAVAGTLVAPAVYLEPNMMASILLTALPAHWSAASPARAAPSPAASSSACSRT